MKNWLLYAMPFIGGIAIQELAIRYYKTSLTEAQTMGMIMTGILVGYTILALKIEKK